MKSRYLPFSRLIAIIFVFLCNPVFLRPVVLAMENVASLERRAETGDPRAHAILSRHYLIGDGVAINPGKAFAHAEFAAGKKDVLGLYALAACYDAGSGVARDENKAERLYKKALLPLREEASGGDLYAQVDLALMYEFGKVVKKDDVEALRWYRRAAKQGYARAQTHLGWKYAHGEGVEQDHAAALHWYQKAADQGYAKALTNMGGASNNDQEVHIEGLVEVEVHACVEFCAVSGCGMVLLPGG